MLELSVNQLWHQGPEWLTLWSKSVELTSNTKLASSMPDACHVELKMKVDSDLFS